MGLWGWPRSRSRMLTSPVFVPGSSSYVMIARNHPGCSLLFCTQSLEEEEL